MLSKNKILAGVTVFLMLFSAGCATTGNKYSTAKSDIVKDYDNARMLYEKGKYEEAAKIFDGFQNNNPESPLYEVALYYEGSCYEKMGDGQKAVSIYQELVDKKHSGYWVDLAKEHIDNIKAAGAL